MYNSTQFTAEYKFEPERRGMQALIALTADGFTFKTAESPQWQFIKMTEIVGMHTYNKHNVVINFGAFPYQSLTCRDEQFLAALKENMTSYPMVANLFKDPKSTFVKLMVVLGGGIVGLILLAYFFLLPWMVKTATNNFPAEYEQKLGKIMFDQVKASEKSDSVKSKLLNDFFDSLHFEKEYKAEILCVSKKEVNAYAMPGGYIVVYDEIINKMNSSEELAGLLAHEYSHVTLKHTLKSIINKIGLTALLQIIFGGTDSAIIGVLSNQTSELGHLQYSRQLEKDADENGFKLMKKQQLNPRGMISLFERLNEVSDTNIPAILSTHPLPDERIKEIENLIQHDIYTPKKNLELDTIFTSLKSPITSIK